MQFHGTAFHHRIGFRPGGGRILGWAIACCMAAMTAVIAVAALALGS